MGSSRLGIEHHDLGRDHHRRHRRRRLRLRRRRPAGTSTSSSPMPTARSSDDARVADPGGRENTVGTFDAAAGTAAGSAPGVRRRRPYSNSRSRTTTLGNNLADYVDGGGVVVQTGIQLLRARPAGTDQRQVGDGELQRVQLLDKPELQRLYPRRHNSGHPLMAGVTTLNSDFQNVVTLAPGATEVAAASNGDSLVGYRPVGGHTSVGIRRPRRGSDPER